MTAVFAGGAAGGLLATAFLGGLVVAPAGAQDSGVDLEAWKDLLFVDGEYYQDPNAPDRRNY